MVSEADGVVAALTRLFNKIRAADVHSADVSPVQTFEQRAELGDRKLHYPVPDRRPGEAALLEPFVSQ